MIRRICITLAALAAGVATAEEKPRPDPADARAKVPPADYRSAFEGYRAFADEQLGDWRRANEEVGIAGGHAGHRPGQDAGPPTAKPQPGPAESAPRPQGHDRGGRHP